LVSGQLTNEHIKEFYEQNIKKCDHPISLESMTEISKSISDEV
jgi:hypothetical protein